MHELPIAHVEVRPQHAANEMLLHRNISRSLVGGLDVRDRPDLLFGFNQFLNCTAYAIHLLVVDFLLAELSSQHLWVTLILTNQVRSQSLRDAELICKLRHVRLISFPISYDGEQVDRLQLAASTKIGFRESLLALESLPRRHQV